MANPVITFSDYILESLEAESLVPVKQFLGGSFVENAIAEKKHLQIELSVDTGLNGYIFYYSAGMDVASGVLFPNLNFAPQHGYKIAFTSAPVVGTTYDLICYSSLVGQEEVLKNHEVKLECIDPTTFLLHHYFYEIYDVDNFMNPSMEDNHSKLLKEKKLSANELTLVGPSKYTGTKNIFSMYIFVDKITNRNEKGYGIKEINYVAGFYEKQYSSGDGHFYDPEFILERAASVVTDLSVVTDTKLTFKIYNPDDVLDSCMLWLIRTDTLDNTVDYLTNYDYSHIKAATNGGAATIHNAYKAPSTGPTALGSDQWKVDVTIDKSKIVFGAKYRAIAVCYQTDEYLAYKVTSFISEEFVADDYPTWTGGEGNFTGELIDYNTKYNNDLICVVEERIQSKLTFAHSTFAAEILARLGITLPSNDIRRYLTRLDLVIYEETVDGSGNTVRQIYDTNTIYKTGATTYTSTPRLSASFGANTSLFDYTWRNRYESHIPNVQTLVNGVALPLPTGDQNWAGKVLTVEWAFHFVYDDWTSPFEDVVRFRQKIRPADYIDDGTFYIDYIYPSHDINSEFICIDGGGNDLGEICLAALHLAASENQYNLIVNIEPVQGNAYTLEEAEAYTDQMPQLTTNKITNEGTLYIMAATEGDFCVDMTKLTPNTTYKISALRKKV
jgi:hypothetical protein